MAPFAVLAALCLTAVSAVPQDVVLSTLGSDLRYQYFEDDNGELKLSDTWLTRISLEDLPIYVPSRDNQFHLFTRANPSVSQPLLRGYENILSASNFNANRPTVFLIHGYQGSVTSNSNLALIPAYLTSADVNVITVDWSRGANSRIIVTSLYATMSAVNIARFANWLSNVSGQDFSEMTMVGFGLSGLKVGVIGRLLERRLGSIVALDPSFGLHLLELLPVLRPDDAMYTEVVHTNVGNLSFIKPMGQVDFYPNGGLNMPGCGRDDNCDRDRAYFYWAESLTSGGFMGVQCDDYEDALNQECLGPATLPMGGITRKTGASGVFSVRTNVGPPFSLG